MPEKKFKVIWGNEIIASKMRLSDAFILIKGLCEQYFNESIDIRLVQDEDENG